MKTLCLVGSIGSYAVAGRQYSRLDGNQNRIDHEVPEDKAEVLLGLQNTPFRVVGDDGEPILNESDKKSNKAVEDDRKKRTVVVPQAKSAEQQAKEREEAIAANKPDATVEVESDFPAYDDITVKEIKEVLEEMEVEYDSSANKKTLYALLKKADSAVGEDQSGATSASQTSDQASEDPASEDGSDDTEEQVEI